MCFGGKGMLFFAALQIFSIERNECSKKVYENLDNFCQTAIFAPQKINFKIYISHETEC